MGDIDLGIVWDEIVCVIAYHLAVWLTPHETKLQV
jgi:hypothetical protein